MYCKNQASIFSHFYISLATGGNLFAHINSAHPTNTCAHAYMDVRMHTHIMHTHTYHAHTRTCLPAHLCLCAHALTHARTHTHTHIYIHRLCCTVVQSEHRKVPKKKKNREEKNEVKSVTYCCMLVVTVSISTAKDCKLTCNLQLL